MKRKMLIALLMLALTLAMVVPAYALEHPTSTVVEDPSAYPWAEDLEEDDVVGVVTAEEMAEYYYSYLELFDDYVYENENTVVGDITYYVYDPTAHGFDADQDYPVCIWFHGAGNQAMGKMAIIPAGAATFASDEYQQTIGGMYIIVPLSSDLGWTTGTVNAIKGIYDIVCENGNTTDELIISGTSAGGEMASKWLEQYAYMTDIVFWMSTTLPDSATIQSYSDLGIHMWYEVSLHDEGGAYYNSFDAEGVEAYEAIENLEITAFEWTLWGNGNIAVVNEDNSYAGQHSTCIQVLRNLIQIDGTPDDPEHPDGVTGWFRDMLALIRAENQGSAD